LYIFKSSFFGKIGMSVSSTTDVFSVIIRHRTLRKLNVPVVVETDQVQGKYVIPHNSNFAPINKYKRRFKWVVTVVVLPNHSTKCATNISFLLPIEPNFGVSPYCSLINRHVYVSVFVYSTHCNIRRAQLLF
jgi:hypothetical protein